MTEENLKAHTKSPWIDFWQNLKEGYDAFEETHLPPRVGICDRRYVVEPQRPGEVGVEGPLALCGVSRAALVEPNFSSLAQLPPDRSNQRRPQDQTLPETAMPSQEAENQRAAYSGRPLPPLPALSQQMALLPPRILRPRNPKAGPAGGKMALGQPPRCNVGLASCRKFLALSSRIDHARAAGGGRRQSSVAGLEISNGPGRPAATSRGDVGRRNVR